jgi:hypothetical protein
MAEKGDPDSLTLTSAVVDGDEQLVQALIVGAPSPLPPFSLPSAMQQCTSTV